MSREFRSETAPGRGTCDWPRGRCSRLHASRLCSATASFIFLESYVDKRHGDALVVRGKAPRAPRTWKGDATAAADVDLRHRSLCEYRSIADGAADDCMYEMPAPLDTDGRCTIVVSTAEARPADARPECGVAWMNWGVGDGIGNPHGGFLAFRHMMPSPGFKNRQWATQGLGNERRAPGDCYPEARYESKAAFEARGCAVRRALTRGRHRDRGDEFTAAPT
jgi:hypothetical protein